MRLVTATVVALAAAAALSATTASGASWSIVNFNMYTTSVNTYGGPFYPSGDYRNSYGEYEQHYRWIDMPPTGSRISTNNCGNIDGDWRSADFWGHTNYERVGFWASKSQCLRLRGRSLGSFSFYDLDGNLLY